MTRTAAEIGASLAPARESRPIWPGERIHVLGIAGAGASAAAIHAVAQGAIVTGCDPGGPSPYTPPLEALRIPIAWSHHASHVTDGTPLDRLAVTKALTAIAPDHPELRAAASRGIPAEAWQQIIADAAHGRSLVAVAGTHGKSTTSGWLAWILAEAGLDPSAFVGALLPAALTGGIPATARVGRGASFVVEADEYAGNFDAYRPDIVVLTNVEWDHPDVFADRAAVLDAFEVWLRRIPEATVVANLSDRGIDELVRRLTDRPGPVVGVTLEPPHEPDWMAETAAPRPRVASPPDRYINAMASLAASGRTSLWLYDYSRDDDDASLGVVELQPAGWHNGANAALVAAAAIELGLTPSQAVGGLSTFPGIGRRLERMGEARGVVVYDDYGHHPTAIRATIAALRQREPRRRLWAVYEPLTFHRTAAMLDDFASALAGADAVAIADIWASRDPDTTITSPEALAAAVRARRRSIIPGRGLTAEAPGSVEETAAWLALNVKPGDAVLVMGGGKSYRIAELLLEHLGGASGDAGTVARDR
jgi:UDP-N-acetylmuramate--alanine ligase